MIKLENVGKIYSTGSNLSVGIRKVNLELKIGEFVAITGESGSGKSTLLNIISGIDSYEEGEMYVNGEETSYYSTADLENYRNKYVGFIFQSYNLVDSYTVLENVESALYYMNIEKHERRKRALELIDKVGLTDRIKFKASKLSGGEKQRVVIARALAKNSPIIAADEPTGNLDEKSSKEIIELLYNLSKDKLVLIVTHDFEEVEKYATRILRVYDGEIIEDRVLKNSSLLDSQLEIKNDEEKLPFKEKITFALKDLFSSPKRTIFYFLVIFILSFFSLITIASYRVEVQDLQGGTSDFSNNDVRRIVLNKKDGTEITTEEMEYIKSLNNVDYVIENECALDSYYYFDIEMSDVYDYVYFELYQLPVSVLDEKSLDYGKLPEKDSEIVIEVSKNDLGNYSFEDLLNKKVNGFTIVGIIDSTYFSDNVSNYVYYYDSKYNEIVDEYYSYRYLNIKIKENGEYEDDYYSTYNGFKIKESDKLKDDEISIDNFYKTNDTVNISIEDFYHSLFSLDNAKLISFEDEEKIEDCWYGYYEETALYLSKTNYEKYKTEYDKIYQVSLFLKNSSDLNIESIKQKLTNQGFAAISPYKDTTSKNMLSIILGAFFLVSTAMFFLSSTMIVYLILSLSIKSRQSDIEILRTIGAKEKGIRLMFNIELIFIGLISYILVMIITFIVGKTTKIGEISSIIKSLNFLDYIAILLLNIIICLTVSSLLCRKMFKKTIKKSLDQR